MRALRITLSIVGFALAFGLLFIGGNAWVPDAWDLPPNSTRYLAYDYLLVKYRWVTAAVMVIYGLLLAVSFREEFLQSFKIEAGREFWVRLLLCSVILVSLVLFWSS